MNKEWNVIANKIKIRLVMNMLFSVQMKPIAMFESVPAPIKADSVQHVNWQPYKE